jgi:hypothetical protein
MIIVLSMLDMMTVISSACGYDYVKRNKQVEWGWTNDSSMYARTRNTKLMLINADFAYTRTYTIPSFSYT